MLGDGSGGYDGGGGGYATPTVITSEGGGNGGLVLQSLPMGPLYLPPTTVYTAPPPDQSIIPSIPPLPVPGNSVINPPPVMDTVPNIVTLTDGPATVPVSNPVAALPTDTSAPVTTPVIPAQKTNSLLWILAALGGAYLLFKDSPKRAGSVGGAKKSLLFPVLVVGGLGAWYLYSKRQAATPTASTSAGDGAAPPAGTPALVLNNSLPKIHLPGITTG